MFNLLLFQKNMARFENLKAYNPFDDTTGDDDAGPGDQGLVHIRIQQRNGRKTLTTVQGLSSEYDFKKIVKVAKRVCLQWDCCGAFRVRGSYPIAGKYLRPLSSELFYDSLWQGDQRENICRLLVDCGLVKSEQLKVHGF